MNDYLALVLGILSAGIGGELFLRGLVGIARWARISAGIIGATLAAFATSIPELSVGIGAALSGKPQISLGDTLGSNVANVGLGNVLGSTIFNSLLIVGVVALICPISVPWREVDVTLIFGIVTLALTWPPRHGFIHRKRGMLLVALYVGYLATIVFLR